MNNKKWIFACSLAFLATATAGCSTTAAPGLKGRWQPVNRFAETAEAIPIADPARFYATSADATLKALLERWAKGSKKTLTYQHPNDFTLHAQVAGIRASNLNEALSELSAAYADYEVSIALEGQAIVVRQQSHGHSNHGP
ncbi:MAG TPA: hypothetical protein VJ806_00745 [Luteimonas sp.]|nr:hypothetical protein [Luteimonas sp.]